MTMVLLLAFGSLPVLLILARILNERRQRDLEEHVTDVLSPRACGALRRWELQLGDLGVGVDLGHLAIQERDRRVLTAAVTAVELSAPTLLEGLRALAIVARTVSVLVAPPPIPPSAWRAAGLRGLAAGVVVLHAIAVSGTERVRLRLWLLGRAFQLAASSFARSAARVDVQPRAWDAAAVALADLGTARTEAGVTYARVLRGLDALGRLAPAA